MMTLRLDAVLYGADDVNLYRFVAEDGGALPGAPPGSHIDVRINDRFTRPYSLINSGDSLDHYLIGVRRDEHGRGGSRAWHDEARVGRSYSVSLPRNNFPLHQNEQPVVLLAGGIGITPMVSMYRDLKRRGLPVVLHYWARDERSFLFRDELEGAGDVRLVAAPGAPPAGRDVAAAVAAAHPGSHLYCCGPGPMMDDFLVRCADRPSELVHIERFAPVDLPDDGRAADHFEVTLARAGTTLSIGPGETILQACLDRGIDVDYSCEEGTCGACESKVISGDVVHRDVVRTAEEHDSIRTMMICCSRSAGTPLVLDL